MPAWRSPASSMAIRTKDDLALRGSAYVVPDILWSSYYDATGAIPHQRRPEGQAVRAVHGPGQQRGEPADGPAVQHLHGRRQGRCDLGSLHAHRRLHADRQRRRLPHAVRHLHRLQQAAGARLRPRRRTIVPDRRDLRLRELSACPARPSWPTPSMAPTRSTRRPARSSTRTGNTISTCKYARDAAGRAGLAEAAATCAAASPSSTSRSATPRPRSRNTA